MEKKTTSRIIGVLVAAALVIILLPMFFTNKESPSETMALNAPPFPDGQSNNENPAELTQNANSTAQPVTPNAPSDASMQPLSDAQLANTAANANPTPATNLDPTGANTTPPNTDNNTAQNTTANSQTPAPVMTPPAISDQQNTAQTTTPNTAAPAETAQPSAENTTPPANTAETPAPAQANAAPATQKPFDPESFDLPGDDPVASNNATSHVTIPAPTPATTNTADNTAEPTQPTSNNKHKISFDQPKINSDTIEHTKLNTKPAEFQTAAWVVQMGSFKNKSNAVHLANRLRAMGYKAFMQQSKAANGEERTHVYVGPEFKKLAASDLANKIAREANMRGILVSYKPLEL